MASFLKKQSDPRIHEVLEQKLPKQSLGHTVLQHEFLSHYFIALILSLVIEYYI